VPVGLLSYLGFCEQPGGDATCALSVHVRHALRGLGIGRALLERAIAAGPMLGFERYAAYVRSDNAAGLALFRGLAFRAWGCLPGVLQSAGQRLDVLLFGIQLA
jgi:phosphinothricin acetyltransferase